MIYLADYKLMWAGTEKVIPQIPESKLYQYILAANGVFLHARRTGLEVVSKVAEPWAPSLSIRGLQPVEEIISCDYPRVPFELTEQMLEWAKDSEDKQGRTVEILFHLIWNETTDKWELVVPEQERAATCCKPVGAAIKPGGSYEKAFIEVHSHHSMRAFFSSTDDADEQGFRIYGVLGDIFKRPTMRLRISVYGQFIEVPAGYFFKLGGEEEGQTPDGGRLVQDAYYDYQVATHEAENLQSVLDFEMESEGLPL